jgi:hypothetical protein
MVQVGGQNIEGCFKQTWYLACSQIWLNLPVDHCYFGYITKLTLPTPKKEKEKDQRRH